MLDEVSNFFEKGNIHDNALRFIIIIYLINKIIFYVISKLLKQNATRIITKEDE